MRASRCVVFFVCVGGRQLQGGEVDESGGRTSPGVARVVARVWVSAGWWERGGECRLCARDLRSLILDLPRHQLPLPHPFTPSFIYLQHHRVIGQRLAARAVAAGVDRVTWVRAGRPFHGRSRAVVEAFREGGVGTG